jgi:hypothetical protein
MLSTSLKNKRIYNTIRLMTDLKTLEQERDKHINGLFWLGLKIALIFGIPAALGAWSGRQLDASRGDDWTFTILFLVIAFFVSWTIVILQYKKIAGKIKVIEDQIKELKSKQENNGS